MSKSDVISQFDLIKWLAHAPHTAALAVIAGTIGPSFRPLGTMMAVADGQVYGAISSGCVEADIAQQAAKAQGAGQPRMVRYGLGSPMMDIQLPCGGGIDVLILPNANQNAFAQVQNRLEQRRACALRMDLQNGDVQVVDDTHPHADAQQLTVLFKPNLNFVTFGIGPEAVVFANLAKTLGYDQTLLSTDTKTIEQAMSMGLNTRRLLRNHIPDDLPIDDRTAVTLFFHDHDAELNILETALASPAFYVGAQGSVRAHGVRCAALGSRGVAETAIDKIHGPAGLFAPARDTNSLAASVLGEVLQKAMALA